ncbi:hypothetical protein J7643_19185 [bacterium]|nr:hypothetical protein [bacterium]
MTQRYPPMPELTRVQIIVGIILGLAMPGGAFAAAWGGHDAQIRAIQKQLDSTVTRAELQPIAENLREMKEEVKGLRSDLIAVIKDRR